MHFITYVVTEEKPTDAVLAKVMAPFMPNALGNDHKLDWYALGGRYTGLLIPHQMANTIKGSFIGDGPGSTGPGVDALQLSNLKHPYAETSVCPAAVVLGGEWYGRDNNDMKGTKHVLYEMGFPDVAEAFDETEEMLALQAWMDEMADLLETVSGNCWIAALDCQRYVNIAGKLLPVIQKLHPNVTYYEDNRKSGLSIPLRTLQEILRGTLAHEHAEADAVREKSDRFVGWDLEGVIDRATRLRGGEE
jgi:hypothetical protein